MFTIRVDDKILSHCKLQVSIYNFGQRGYADGNKEQQLTGIIGQSVIMSLFGQNLIDGSTGFDHGTDILFNNLIIDVKTMGRTTDVRDYYVNNFMAIQFKYNTDVYIFCSYNKTNNILTICGWITKKSFKERASFYKKGTVRKRSDGSTFKTFHDLYEIKNTDLNDVMSHSDLIEQLSAIK